MFHILYYLLLPWRYYYTPKQKKLQPFLKSSRFLEQKNTTNYPSACHFKHILKKASPRGEAVTGR